MNAILYGRFSTDKQDMQRQVHMLELYCQARALPILDRIYDPDVSGSVPMEKREGGRRLLAYLTGAPVAIVVAEQDRIGRDTIDQIQTLRAIWNAGAVPHFVAEGGPMERNPENEMRMELRASVAQYEKNKIKQRINSEITRKRAHGELCGTVPYGFDAVPTGTTTVKGKLVQRLVDNPAEQKWILHMVSLRAAGWGYHSIAKDLNERGALTKRGRGEIMNLRTSEARPNQPTLRFSSGRWQAGNVSKVLNNKTVKAWLSSRDGETSAAA